jgi:hypothetical protein
MRYSYLVYVARRSRWEAAASAAVLTASVAVAAVAAEAAEAAKASVSDSARIERGRRDRGLTDDFLIGKIKHEYMFTGEHLSAKERSAAKRRLLYNRQ